ncbi:unnamed protein product [Symbiodinium natans]|uniref:Uncharacterized protein n=1 Tax=Symbiodinium natans TaxID=878477 RepID=A0A812GBM9_9DINO|nr:unnamed protein product [Symbiodinium natans]
MVAPPPRALCNQSSNIRWASIRHELGSVLDNSADFFRQLSVRRHFKWLLAWFSTTAHTNIWLSGCPLGVLTLRLFTVLISNDADRCIQMRDARMGLDLIHVPLADVVESGWPAFRILALLAEEQRRISYPLDSACDNLDSSSGRAFRTQLAAALAARSTLPLAEAEAHLREPPPRCVLGDAAAYFVLAASHDASAPQHRELLEKGQAVLLEWTPLRRSLYDILTTRWPVWRALERTSIRPNASLPNLRGWVMVVASCSISGHNDTFNAAQYSECGQQSHPALVGIYVPGASLLSTSVVVLLSPLLWSGLDSAWEALVSGVRALQYPSEFQTFSEVPLDADIMGRLGSGQRGPR